MLIKNFFSRLMTIGAILLTLSAPLMLTTSSQAAPGHCSCGRGHAVRAGGWHTSAKSAVRPGYRPHLGQHGQTDQPSPLMQTISISFIISALIFTILNWSRLSLRRLNPQAHSHPAEAHAHTLTELLICAIAITVALIVFTDNFSIIGGIVIFWTAVQLWHDRWLKYN